MEKITISFCFLLLNIHSFTGQSVYEIHWEIGTHTSLTSPTIEIGDTIKWIWTDSEQKSVTSLPKSRENFDSGLLDGVDKSFSYTFSKAGITEYENEANPSMVGKVTVAHKLSLEDKFVKNLNFYPNPVKNYLTISSLFKITGYKIYNVLGSKVAEGNSLDRTTTIDITKLNSGLYFVKVFSNNMQSTLKIAKK